MVSDQHSSLMLEVNQNTRMKYQEKMSFFTGLYDSLREMFKGITTSDDHLDLVLKLWISIMVYVIFRMGAKHFRKIELQNSRSQQDIRDLYSAMRNWQHGNNAEFDRFAVSMEHHFQEDNRMIEVLFTSIQDNAAKIQENSSRVHDIRTRLLKIESNQRNIEQIQQNIESIQQGNGGAQVPVQRTTVEKLKDNLKTLHTHKDSAFKELHNLANNLDEHFANINKAKIAGSAVSIGGGVLVVVGFALIPVSFGSSMILSIVGGAISGIGGATAGGSSLVESVLSSKRRKSAMQILNDYNALIEELKVECVEIGQILSKNCSNMETEFESWCSFWNKLVLGASSTTRLSWDAIVNPILRSLRLASFGEDVAAAGLRGASVVGNAFTIVGGVTGILFLPLDIYTLVDSAIDVHKNNPHKISKKIREYAEKIDDGCPTEEDIEIMIRATFD